MDQEEWTETMIDKDLEDIFEYLLVVKKMFGHFDEIQIERCDYDPSGYNIKWR